MNNEVNELRAELLREKLANQELANSLQKEKEKSILLEKSLGSLRKSYETFHNQAEMEEEKFVNKLISKIDDLKKGKEKLAYELESEEEHITLTFQLKLSKLQSQLDVRDHEIERLRDEIYRLRSISKDCNDQLSRDSFRRQGSITSTTSDRYSVCSSVEDL